MKNIPAAHSGTRELRGARGRRISAAAAWATTPAGRLALLIATSFLARLLFAASLGLGIDESYMVAAGRKLQLSYFDHPPVAWWMAWAATHLAGSQSPLIVRLPFISAFALTTLLMYRVTSSLFTPTAGLAAAAVLNIAPVFGMSSASWVLPDGPLFAALLGGVACLIPALGPMRGTAWGWWAGAGACAGLALCSKYSAVLTLIGLVAFLLTEPTSRRWLARPQPYVAGLIALAIFSPVLLWNAEHGWVSLLFQGGRAEGAFRPFGPIVTFAGEAVFLLPWIWAPLIACGFFALRRGPADRDRWLLVCLAAPPVVVFAVVSFWSKVLFHWAAPGYLMLIPLLGDATARHWQGSRPVRLWLAASALFVALATALYASDVRFNWLPASIADVARGNLRDVDVVDWTLMRQDLADRGLLDRPNLIVAAMRWTDAGKIDYALEGRIPVICLGPDARQYGVTTNRDDYAGYDVLIATRLPFEKIVGQYWFLFDRIDPLPPVPVSGSARAALRLNLFLGHGLHKAADECCAS
ncbi:MAG: glycosyltransferase family 39 protein [Alphaproteobacteria bacterium]|nr:glycosyltransferase family 39 protein [Alphaproteobacteria bacterium]